MVVTGFETKRGTEPAPTAFRVLAGTLATSRSTVAGRAVPAGEAAEAEPGLAEPPGFRVALNTMRATTTATTARMLAPVMRIRLRISARCAAARCAAIRSRALSRLVFDELLIVSPRGLPPTGGRLGQRRDFSRWSSAGLTP